ncbi:26S proteasome regulatory complex, subunit PSMD10 [Handroanthus impetiginosus]|uniref:26S proteasome regulatory complex, subunit PSMD10 n=1 Tax=Handroanthus impetiginosus TaxID=429701 RepID=A0A2G9H431_9LAMI|nr:26S proteasome regulatory complex, subunit PSMD10 [Handroanthus impetiginosus]
MSECECESHQVQTQEPAPEARMEMINEYARRGDITGLYSSIKNDPQLLKDMDEIQFIRTPLHEAAAFGKTDFALEILNLMPSFGKKLNPEGLSPLHLALDNREVTTARSLVRMDKQLVRVKGKEGLTPLHFAAKNASNHDELEILADFLHECPESIHDLNSRFQTAVHVALTYNDHNGASTLLLNWIRLTSKESVLESEDVDGNTALHTAVKCYRTEAAKVLVQLVKLNPKNESGKTPLDIAEEYEETADVSNETALDIVDEYPTATETVKTILINAGARKAKQLPKLQSNGQYLQSKISFFECLFQRCYSSYRDFVLNMRSDIMVVAVLITTATYQAVLQPPGGVYPPEGNSRLAMSDAALSSNVSGSAGKMVMKKHDYHDFMPANTMAFTLSIVMILLVVQGRPSSIFLLLCLIFLARSYHSAMKIISNSSMLTIPMLYVCAVIIYFALGLKFLFILVKSLIGEVRTLRLNTMVQNKILDRCTGQRIQIHIQRLVRHYHLIKYGK